MSTQEVIEGWRGVAVACGLGTPTSRGVTAALAVAVVSYALKYPRGAFRQDGTIRPAHQTDRHFFLTPLVTGAAVALFT